MLLFLLLLLLRHVCELNIAGVLLHMGYTYTEMEESFPPHMRNSRALPEKKILSRYEALRFVRRFFKKRKGERE